MIELENVCGRQKHWQQFVQDCFVVTIFMWSCLYMKPAPNGNELYVGHKKKEYVTRIYQRDTVKV